MSFEPDIRVQYFSGEWVDHGAEAVGVRLALRALWGAAQRCPSHDVRPCPHVAEALEYLQSKTTRRGGFGAWRRALELQDPAQRFQAARAAYEQICQHLGQLLR